MQNKYEENIQKLRSIEEYEERRAFIAMKIAELDKKCFPIEYKNSNPKHEPASPEEQERIQRIVEQVIDEFLEEN